MRFLVVYAVGVGPTLSSIVRIVGPLKDGHRILYGGVIFWAYYHYRPLSESLSLVLYWYLKRA